MVGGSPNLGLELRVLLAVRTTRVTDSVGDRIGGPEFEENPTCSTASVRCQPEFGKAYSLEALRHAAVQPMQKYR